MLDDLFACDLAMDIVMTLVFHIVNGMYALLVLQPKSVGSMCACLAMSETL